MSWTYLIINLCSVIVPFLFSFHRKIRFDRNFKAFFLVNAITTLVFVTWDVYFTKLGVWGFNPKYLLGSYIINLPIEEILFFICIPFSCIFTYYCLSINYELKLKPILERLIIPFLIIAMLIIGLYNWNKLYTSSVFISLGILLFFVKYIFKCKGLGKLLYIYPVLLIPFFIVNGILTGTGIDEQVVWYNNNENMGIRILTIPLEDMFYGFELILVNLILFDYFRKGGIGIKLSR